MERVGTSQAPSVFHDFFPVISQAECQSFASSPNLSSDRFPGQCIRCDANVRAFIFADMPVLHSINSGTCYQTLLRPPGILNCTLEIAPEILPLEEKSAWVIIQCLWRKVKYQRADTLTLSTHASLDS